MIRTETADGVLTLTIARSEAGNTIDVATARALAEALRNLRDDPSLGAAVLTGEGDRFFCVGGSHDPLERLEPSSALPMVDIYELLDVVPKPIVAAVNGFAVGGGQVLQMMCDLSVAAESAVFRQVGPMVGSFDAGYGTWYLEQLIGRRRAKEMWYLNKKYTAAEALAMGLVNEVVPDGQAVARATQIAADLLTRGPGAIAGLKGAFAGRHHGVLGQARIAHDQLLTRYLSSEESQELSQAFKEKRLPRRETFGH